MTPRRMRETQRAYVARVLRERGSIAAYDVLYQATYEDGRKFSITRLAAIIHDLRASGLEIDSHTTHGTLATYTLNEGPAWRCVSCGGPATNEPQGLLADEGRGWCRAENGWQTFRRRQAVPA